MINTIVAERSTYQQSHNDMPLTEFETIITPCIKNYFKCRGIFDIIDIFQCFKEEFYISLPLLTSGRETNFAKGDMYHFMKVFDCIVKKNFICWTKFRKYTQRRIYNALTKSHYYFPPAKLNELKMFNYVEGICGGLKIYEFASTQGTTQEWLQKKKDRFTNHLTKIDELRSSGLIIIYFFIAEVEGGRAELQNEAYLRDFYNASTTTTIKIL